MQEFVIDEIEKYLDEDKKNVPIGLYAGRHGIIEPFDDGFRLRIVRRSLRIGVNTLGLLFHRCQSLHRAANRQTERT